MRVRWLHKALGNLDDEAGYVATDDLAAAGLIVERVLQAAAALEQQPGIGRPGRVPGARESAVLKTRCTLPCRVRGDGVEILRVLHASRRLPQRR